MLKITVIRKASHVGFLDFVQSFIQVRIGSESSTTRKCLRVTIEKSWRQLISKNLFRTEGL